MGFFESLVGAMKKMGFKSATDYPQPDNYDHLWEEIRRLEAKGKDASQYREYIAQQEAKKRAAEDQQEKVRIEYMESVRPRIDYSKLEPYKNGNRPDDFITAAGASTCSKYVKNIATAPMVYAAVVQANNQLYFKGDAQRLPLVIVFSLSENHRFDKDWLLQKADYIQDLKEASNVPAEAKNFVEVLNDDQSIFCFHLHPSIVDGDENTWCVTYNIPKQSLLPFSIIPPDDIIPLMVVDPLRDGYSAMLAMVPSAYYSK